MAEGAVEFVVGSDCSVDGEAFLAGEVRSVPKGIYRQLAAAGRVCKDPELAEQLKAERAKLAAPSSDDEAAAKAAAEEAAKRAADEAAQSSKGAKGAKA